MSEPRAYTPDEMREQLAAAIRSIVRYWAIMPNIRAMTGTEVTNLDRCEGVAHSILATLAGDTLGLPAFTISADPHPDDKEFHIENGLNWFEAGRSIGRLEPAEVCVSRPPG